MLDNTTWQRQLDAARKLLLDNFGKNDDLTALANSELRRLLDEKRARGEAMAPKKGERRFKKHESRPAPQDEINHAMKLAADVIGINPDLLLKVQPRRHSGRSLVGQRTHHARAYAAFALRALYPDNNQSAFGEWVRHKSAQNFISTLDMGMRSGSIRWWNDEKFMHVLEGIETFQKEKADAAKLASVSETPECVG